MSGLHVIYATGRGEVRLLKKVKQGVKTNDKVAIITVQATAAVASSDRTDPKQQQEEEKEKKKEEEEKDKPKEEEKEDSSAAPVPQDTSIESYLKSLNSRTGKSGGSGAAGRVTSIGGADSSTSSDKLFVMGGVGGKVVGMHSHYLVHFFTFEY